MTVIDTTDTTQTDAISFELELRHRPEKVWRALCEPALLAEWLLPVVKGTLAPGADFEFQTQAFPGWDGTVQCTILAIEPHTTLRYAWVVANMLTTEVRFTLTPTSSGTHLSIVQSGFKPDQKQNFGGARYGWKMMGDKLFGVLDRL